MPVPPPLYLTGRNLAFARDGNNRTSHFFLVNERFHGIMGLLNLVGVKPHLRRLGGRQFPRTDKTLGADQNQGGE